MTVTKPLTVTGTGTLTSTLTGDFKNTITGAITNTITGAITTTQTGAYTNTITGAYKKTITGATTIDVTGALNLKSSGAIKITGTTVDIDGPAGINQIENRPLITKNGIKNPPIFCLKSFTYLTRPLVAAIITMCSVEGLMFPRDSATIRRHKRKGTMLDYGQDGQINEVESRDVESVIDPILDTMEARMKQLEETESWRDICLFAKNFMNGVLPKKEMTSVICLCPD